MKLTQDHYTDLQMKACALRAKGLTKYQAYKQTYSTGATKASTIRSHATDFFQKPKIAELVARLSERGLQEINVTPNKVIRELAAVAFASPLDLIETDRHGILRLKPLEQLTTEQRLAVRKLKLRTRTRTIDDGTETIQETEIELHGKIQALELLGRNLGMFSQRVTLEVPRLDYQPIPAAAPQPAADGSPKKRLPKGP